MKTGDAAVETATFMGHAAGTFDLERVVSMLEERIPIAVGAGNRACRAVG